MGIDDYRNQSVSMRGSAAFAEQRDNVQNPFLNDKSLFFARVTFVDQARRTISCVGLNSRFAHGPWDNVPVISMSATQREGSTWLPTIAPPAGETPATQARLDGDRDAIAVITFVEGNPNLPICIGFIFPGPNELSIPGMNINRYASNVYEAFSLGGEYEMVFPDGTFMKIATASSPDLPINLTSTNLDAYTNPWSIDRDVDRKILLSHSGGNKLRISGDGVELQSYKIENFGLNPPTLAASSILDSLGNYTLSATVANLTAPAINATGNVSVTGNLYLNGTSIDTLISNKVNSMFGGNNGGGGSTTVVISQSSIADGSITLSKLASNISSLFTGSTTLTLNASAIANGSLSIDKLSVDIATQAELDAHTGNSSIHLQLGSTSSTAAPGDHTHAVYSSSGTITYGLTNQMALISSAASAGTTGAVARIDHAHAVNFTSLSASPVAISENILTNVKGTLSSFALADHIHATPATWTPSTHAHSYSSLLADSGNISIGSDTVSLQTTSGNNSILLSPNGSIVLTGGIIDIVGQLKVNGRTLTELIAASNPNVIYMLTAVTSDAVSDKIFTTDNLSIFTSTNHLLVPQNQVISFRAEIIANYRSGVAGGQWIIDGSIRRPDTVATTTLVGQPSFQVFADELLENAHVQVVAENTNFGSLQFSVRGPDNYIVNWTLNLTVYGYQAPAVFSISSVSSGGTGSSSSVITDGGSLPAVTNDAQYGMYMLKGTTTGTETIRLTSDAASASSANVPIMINNSAWMTSISIVANNSGLYSGIWTMNGLFRRASSAASSYFLGPLKQEEAIDDQLGTTTVVVDADTSLGGINISVSGSPSTLIHWLAIIETTELL